MNVRKRPPRKVYSENGLCRLGDVLFLERMHPRIPNHHERANDYEVHPRKLGNSENRALTGGLQQLLESS